MPIERGLVGTTLPQAHIFSTLSDWEVIINHCSPGNDTSVVEAVVWQDDAGPFVISEITSQAGRYHRLRMGDEFSVDVHQRGVIVANCPPRTFEATLDHFLADQVLPRVLAHNGGLILHAGAVRTGDNAILVMGTSGSGKSTLVTSFDQAGYALLGDDAMVISWHDNQPCAKAVYPSLRLLPDSIEALFPAPIATTSVADYTSKQRINLSVGNQDATPLPIQAIFAIADPTADGQIQLCRLTVAQACMSFVESSFALDPSDTARARDRLKDASALAHSIPTFEIAYPRDYSQLYEVRQAILDKVAALEPA